MSKPVFVLNGPNLNLLGRREPEHYGRHTLDDIRSMVEAKAASLGLSVRFHQSNCEGELIGWIHEAIDEAAALIINAGAYSHGSLAIRDAISALPVPAIDVHLSNIHAREPFRHRSLIAEVARGSITGLGPIGYVLALEAVAALIQDGTAEGTRPANIDPGSVRSA